VSLETIFGVKILKFFDARDPGWKKFGSGMEKFGSGIQDNHPGSATLLLGQTLFPFPAPPFLILHEDKPIAQGLAFASCHHLKSW
jgi:hypothetical protein